MLFSFHLTIKKFQREFLFIHTLFLIQYLTIINICCVQYDVKQMYVYKTANNFDNVKKKS